MKCNKLEKIQNIASALVDRGVKGDKVMEYTIYNIVKNYPGLKSELESMLLTDMGVTSKVYNNETGEQGYEGKVVSVKLEEMGKISLVVKKANGTTYPYSGVSLFDGTADGGSRVPVATDRWMTIVGSNVTSKLAIGGMFTETSVRANTFVSHMIIGLGEDASGLVGPKLKEWHEKLMNEGGVYAETYSYLSEGFRDSDVVAKIKESLFLTGDMDMTKLNELTTISEKIARRSNEILQTAMPKLHRLVNKHVTSKKDRKLLVDIFATSGFGNIMSMPKQMDMLRGGWNIDEIIDSIGASEAQIKTANELMEYQVNRNVVNIRVTNAAGDKKVAALVVLMAMKQDDSKGYKLFKKVYNKNRELYKELVELSAATSNLNSVVNENRNGTSFGKPSGRAYEDFDGHGLMDVYDNTMEFKIIDSDEFAKREYQSKESTWTSVRKQGNFIVVARKSLSSVQEGIISNKDRIRNGIVVNENQINGMSDRQLAEANIVYTGGVYRLVLTDKEYQNVGGSTNISDIMYRSYEHNGALVSGQAVREIVTKSVTMNGSYAMLEKLEARIKANKKLDKENRKPVPMLLNIEKGTDIDREKYPGVYKMYVGAENISKYGGFNGEITHVKKAAADIIVGFSKGALISDKFPKLQLWEKHYKELVQMMKLKWVVASPSKLSMDIMSNTGVLMAMDIPIEDISKYTKEAFNGSIRVSKLEGELVAIKLEMQRAEAVGKFEITKRLKNKYRKKELELQNDDFYGAIKHGFVQSMGTSMMIKEFDTISGLQHSIDSAVEKITSDKAGNRNGIGKAIEWWMDAGFSVDEMMESASKSSLVNGTKLSEELISIGKRLKDKKNNKDIVRYVSEFLAAPSSEVVRIGSVVMQMGDLTARWVVYKNEFSKLRSEGKSIKQAEEIAAIKGLQTFVDYRLNMPKEIQIMSDYGVMLFPSFWMRTQKVIAGLALNHPLNTGIGYLVADLLGLSGASLMDVNLFNKALQGQILFAGQNPLSISTLLWNPVN